LEFEWAFKVKKIATTTLQLRRFNKEKALSAQEDFEKINRALKQNIKELKLDPNPQVFRRVEMLAQNRLLLYNKRRSGEIEAVGQVLNTARFHELYLFLMGFVPLATARHVYKYGDGVNFY